MSDTAKPLVYLILGAIGSGRREVLVDLIESGLDADEPAAVLLAETEGEDPFDDRLPQVTRWAWQEGSIVAPLPPETTRIFFVTDGRRNPVDQVEAFKAWLETHGAEMARVICVVHCQLAEQHPPLLAWYEACVHFSDVALLSRREGVANKWMSTFLAHFKKHFGPCLFELVKNGQVANPALILDTQARRMTHLFDAEQDWIFTGADGAEIDEQEEVEDEDEVEVKPEEDPYLARRTAVGRRVKEIPDITKFL